MDGSRSPTPSGSRNTSGNNGSSSLLTSIKSCCAGLCPCLFASHGYQALRPPTKRSNSQPVYSLGLGEDDTDDEIEEILMSQVTRTENRSHDARRKKDALDTVDMMASCIEANDFSASFEGNLSEDAVKILFEPIGIQGLERLARALTTNTSVKTLELGINEIDTKNQSLSDTVNLLRVSVVYESDFASVYVPTFYQ